MKPSKLSMSCKLLGFFIVFSIQSLISLNSIESEYFVNKFQKENILLIFLQNTKKICNRSPEYNVIF